MFECSKSEGDANAVAIATQQVTDMLEGVTHRMYVRAATIANFASAVPVIAGVGMAHSVSDTRMCGTS